MKPCLWCGEDIGPAHGNTRYHPYCRTAKRNIEWNGWRERNPERRREYMRDYMRRYRLKGAVT